MMSLGQFINLNEYYQQKSKQSNKNQNNILYKENL